MSKTKAQNNQLTHSHRARGARDKKEPNFLGPAWNLRLIFYKSMEPNSKNNSLFQWLLEGFKLSKLQLYKGVSLSLSYVHCVCSVRWVCVCAYVHGCTRVCMFSDTQYDHMSRFIYPLPQSCNMFLKYKVILLL